MQKKEIHEKEIIEEILCIRNSFVNVGNRDIFGKFGLTFNSYVPLKMIFYGLETITQMKEVYNESAASLGQKIQKLENMGLVTRELDGNDKRRWNFKLSQKGEDILHKVEEKFEKVSEKLFLNFSEKEKQEFYAFLEKIENNL